MGQLSQQNSQLIEGQSSILSEEITIFLFDVSGSMSDSIAKLEEDEGKRFSYSQREFSTPKIDALREAAEQFISQRRNAIANGAKDRVGVITFGKTVSCLQDPCSNAFDTLISRINSIYPAGTTPLATAIKKAVDISEKFTTGFIRFVVCTDGYPDSYEGALDSVRIAAEDYGIVTDCIGIGSEGNFNPDFLKKLAAIGGGEYTHFASQEGLIKHFLSIEGERQALLGNGILLLENK